MHIRGRWKVLQQGFACGSPRRTLQREAGRSNYVRQYAVTVSLVPFLNQAYPNGHCFMQDNDPKHTSCRAQAFFSEQNINWWRIPPRCKPNWKPVAWVKRKCPLLQKLLGLLVSIGHLWLLCDVYMCCVLRLCVCFFFVSIYRNTSEGGETNNKAAANYRNSAVLVHCWCWEMPPIHSSS